MAVTHVLDGIIVLCVLSLAMCVFLSFRNIRVYNFKMELLAKVNTASEWDISNGQPWKWRYDLLESVEYNTMLFRSIWRSGIPMRWSNFLTERNRRRQHDLRAVVTGVERSNSDGIGIRYSS